MELLIVDSSRSFIEALERRLGSTFTIRYCTDGEAALQALGERKPDLLLIHMALPRKDGLTVLLQMAQRPEKILVMTNYVDARVTKRLHDLGVDQMLIQPSVNAVAVWLMELSGRTSTLLPRERFSQKLQSLGFSSAMGGYEKILLALELLEKEPGLQLKEHIYPYVGVAAEKSIRDAIASAYRYGDRQAWNQLFPNGRPTNKAFLRRILQADQDRKP